MTSLRAIAILILLAWGVSARADTSVRCGQAPNLACANSAQTATQDVSTVHNLTGTLSPWTLDGTTANANKITVSLTADPAASFTARIPADADSAMAKSKSAVAGQALTAFDATTGAFTQAAVAASSLRWDQLTDPTASLSLAMGANTTTFTWGAATGAATNMLTVSDTASNTGTGYVLALNTATSSAARPLRVTVGGTANGVDVSTSGVLAKMGTGSVQADNIAFGSDARGDLAVRGASVYGRVGIGGSATFLRSNGTDPSWQQITSSDIGAGDLANALTWNESCTASPCTLAASPRTADTALVVWRTVTLRRVTTCGGVNEYTLSGTTLTLCDSTGIGTGVDSLKVTYEV